MTPVPSSLVARAHRALRRQGLLGFLRLALLNVGLILSGRHRQHRYAYDDAFDRAFGVDTSGTVAVEEIDAPVFAKRTANRYEPTDPACFEALLDLAEVRDRAAYRFIDLGSGKGRVLLLAARAGFRRIEGVEFGRDLHMIAEENIRLFLPSVPGAAIRSHHGDAAAFDFRSEPSVCFLNNPFGAEVLLEVLERAEASLAQAPRDFILIYYHSNHSALLDDRRGWRACARGHWRDPSHHYAIYRWAPEPVERRPARLEHALAAAE